MEEKYVLRQNIIEKWYKVLEFPEEYDEEFYQALKDIEISDSVSVKTYNDEEPDGKRNLLSFLYMCEDLSRRYEEKKINDEILVDTLKDIVIWTKTWTDIKNTLHLSTLYWLKRHLDMKLFKIGRLQFCMGQMEEDVPSENLSKGDNVLEIHIPACGPMTQTVCEESIKMAKEFFKNYYPNFDYKCFTCHSWLLDESLKEILEQSSNIIKFQDMFYIVSSEKSDAILKYIFKWNTTRENLKDMDAVSGFAQKVKNRILSGNDFYESYGILKK